MATRNVFVPESASFPDSNSADRLRVNARYVLAFDAGTDETCYWTDIAPQGLSGTITVIVHYIMASATTGRFTSRRPSKLSHPVMQSIWTPEPHLIRPIRVMERFLERRGMSSPSRSP